MNTEHPFYFNSYVPGVSVHSALVVCLFVCLLACWLVYSCLIMPMNVCFWFLFLRSLASLLLFNKHFVNLITSIDEFRCMCVRARVHVCICKFNALAS